MRLRPLLSSCVVVALALVAAHLAMIASNARNSDQLEREREAIEVIARDAAGLLGLTQDFALHQDDRSQRQWGLVHAEVVRTLRAYAAAGAVQLDEADDLLEVAQGLPDLFKSLRAALAAPDTPRAAARRETLSDQTINETRRISDGAFEVSHRVAERAQREVVIQRWVAIAAQTALLSLILLLAWVLRRRVLAPIQRLQAVTQAVQAGDLSARSGYQHRDELGELSRRFDAMAGRLLERESALRELNAELALSEALLRRTGATAGVGGWQLDVAARTLVWTDQTRHLMGADPDYQPNWRASLAMVEPEHRAAVIDALQAAVNARQPFDLELPLQTLDRRQRWIRMVGQADNAGLDSDVAPTKASRLVGSIQDVTDRHQAHAELQHSMRMAESANAAKSEFLANMSHEIRTPLNAMIGVTHMLADTALDADQHSLLSKAQIASRALLGIVNDVLDLAKVEAGEMELELSSFDPGQLLVELASLFRPQAQAKGLSLSTSLAPDVPPRLVGDAFKLNQMLSNLVGNAIKFTTQGGVRVQLTVTHAPSTGPMTDPQPAELELCWSVHDSGIGIAPEVQRRLFTPFTQADSSTTRRFGGTGLGLSIVRSMAQRMGGSAGVDSVPGQGSSFWLRLPMACPGPSQDDALDRPAQDAVVGAEQAPSQAPSEAPLDARKTHWLPGMRLLLVDDSDINLDVARHLLERHGAEVHCCADGSQAVQWLRASPDAVDAVLMDVQMPVMDGLEATRLIRSGLGLTRLPVVALTAGALVEERRRTLAAGMNGFISKPIDPDSLVRTLRRVVEEGRQGAWPIRNLAASASVTTSVAALPGVARPATLSVPPVPAVAGDAWPTVDGIDAASTAQRLNHDAGLFRKILGWLLRDFADLGREPVRLPPKAQARRALALRLHKLSGSAANVGAVGVQHHAGAAAVGLHRLIDASAVDAGTADPDQVLATQQSLDALSAAVQALEVASASALAAPLAALPRRQAQAEAESA